MNILHFIPRFSGLPAMATLPILARFRPQEKYAAGEVCRRGSMPHTASGRRSGDRHQIRVPVAVRVAVSERLTVSSPVYAACSLHVWTFIDAHGTAGADF